MANETILELTNLVKKFGNVVAVNNLSIPYIKRGEFVTFLGPSGCGKTTLLRMIGGFYYPSAGDIIMHGERINDIPPEKRKTSMVFQNYALFPHMNVFDNIAYGLRVKKLSRKEIEKKVLNVLSVVQLEGLGDRKPTQLSGGQQQRVALARCIVIEPQIILLDEPLSNLDANLRVMMREEIRKIQQSLDLTTIFVTHDQEEAMSMADRIVVMNQGKIEQIGTPIEIYEKPASLFVAGFIGHINLVKGKIKSRQNETLTIATDLGEFINMNEDLKGFKAGDTATIVIRPEASSLEKAPSKGKGNSFQGRIRSFTYIGYIARYYVEVSGRELPFIIDISNPGGRGILKKGEQVTITLPLKFHCIKT
ncbi:MAG: ABC transporter ATP-binding protein [Planctomycetes bacterium]|nr:ABC transporter ATP-binding protein [Planctomycetota bacterium]